MNNSTVAPRKSKLKEIGRAVNTKNHNFMYMAAAFAGGGLFAINTSFNGWTGWIQGGLTLCLAYIALDLCMGYFVTERLTATGKRRMLCNIGAFLTVSCSLISLITCLTMFDAQRSVDYTKATAIASQTEALKEVLPLIDSSHHPKNYYSTVQEIKASIKDQYQAKYEAVESLGYAPEHAAYKSEKGLFKYIGVSIEWVRVYMGCCVLLTSIIFLLVFKHEETTDIDVEPANDLVNKPKYRVYNQGDGVVSV